MWGKLNVLYSSRIIYSWRSLEQHFTCCVVCLPLSTARWILKTYAFILMITFWYYEQNEYTHSFLCHLWPSGSFHVSYREARPTVFGNIIINMYLSLIRVHFGFIDGSLFIDYTDEILFSKRCLPLRLMVPDCMTFSSRNLTYCY